MKLLETRDSRLETSQKRNFPTTQRRRSRDFIKVDINNSLNHLKYIHGKTDISLLLFKAMWFYVKILNFRHIVI